MDRTGLRCWRATRVSSRLHWQPASFEASLREAPQDDGIFISQLPSSGRAPPAMANARLEGRDTSLRPSIKAA
jgi:hypothetical protein